MTEKACKIKKMLDEKTKIPCAKITLTDSAVNIFSSKVGGKPYLPKDGEIPKDSDGNSMRLLAQIRCEDIADMPYYPTKGMLQFFIGGEDYGLDFDDQTAQTNFKVIYREEIDETVNESDIPEIEENEDDFFPVCGEFGMKFEISEQPINFFDYRFEKELASVSSEVLSKDDAPISDEEMEMFGLENEPAHQLGGYPFFTQEDPRDGRYSQYKKYDWILFQLDSEFDDAEKVMWGDCGVCNFMISLEDLKNQNFSDVLYNWDCY